MPKCTILCGISGSGKSTYAKEVLGKDMYFSADNYFIDRESGAYNFDPTKLGEAHGQCLRFAADEMRYGKYNVVIDNTNTTVAEIAPYAALALAYGYELEIVRLSCDLETASKRNVHNVPAHVIEAQLLRLETLPNNLPSWWKLTDK